ncbi:MAG: 4-hydroxy-3-methylbut-2-enyl diphosphate reductase [Sedimentisphaerales bacterium]|nr:4-hydroxy-3-methylbut-2-enyl diphosphate reductase [Sedimentisphaerales bacterium]
MMMEVLIAEKRGFCFGVEHAIEMAQRLLDEGKEVYSLGPLIHNSHVVKRLSDNGLQVVESLDQIGLFTCSCPENPSKPTPTVLIRSHGCRPEIMEQIMQRGLELADATCILVKKAQKLVKQLFDQGYQVIIVGDPNHPEVQGVVGYAPNVVVVAGPEDVRTMSQKGKIAVISQTTYSAEDFGKIVGLIAMKGFEEIKVVNTICRETSRRQASAVELCKQVDVMFVLGSHHSANTAELAQLCKRNGVMTYHLQGWDEFEPQYVEGKSIAGVTAGASTPDWIIQEFVERLANIK